MGPRQEDNSRKRSIRVKVNDMRLKKQILKRKGQLRGSHVFVKEHLMAKNSAIFYQARRARDFYLLFNVWTENGRVWATPTENANPILLTNADEIEDKVKKAIADGVIPRQRERDTQDHPNNMRSRQDNRR